MGAFEANLSLPAGAAPPDPWSDDYGTTLPLGHIISRNKNGSPVSTVGDFFWDLTPYDPLRRRSIIYFYYWTDSRGKINPSELAPARVARVHELQYLMVKLIYRKNVPAIGASSAKAHLKGLFHIARFAERMSCAIRDVLINRDVLDSFIKNVSGRAIISIVFWLKFLWELESNNELGYQVAKPRRWSNLQRRAKELWDSYKQTAPIPSRIYASLINALSSELDDIEAHKERLLAALRASVREYDGRKDRKGNLGPALIERYGLEDYLAARGLSKSLNGLSGAVSEIFRICKLQIHVFSGMRDTEAQYLPFHCMVAERRTHGRRHSLIAGITTKLEGGGRRRAKWVTTEREGFQAIRLVQQFASVIYGCIGVTPDESENSREKYPLFISLGYLPWMIGRFDRAVDQPSESYTVASSNLTAGSLLRVRLRPIIEEEDLAELEEIDPFRAWRDEPEYAVGQPWPLKPHQLRRSLALYANASGLVRLSSLRRQLQHITREMSLYYARGSAFAINFIAEDPKGYKRHVAAEWQDGEQEAEYLTFVRDVLESDEPMYGPAGTYYEMQKRRNTILPPEEFKRQIKMGRLAYRSSPLGGCTNPDRCQSLKGLRLINTTCATEGCKHLIGKHSRIIETIRLQRGTLSHIDPESIQYQMEQEELDALIATELLWRPKDGHIEI